MSRYSDLKAAHASSPAYEPPVPLGLLGPIALVTLSGFFALAFIFSTLPKSRNPIPELSTGVAASLLAGAGAVALFCTLGVYV